MDSSSPRCRVRLTEDAVSDLYRLQKKDPRIVRDVFKKMLLLERAADAGEPLLGALVGFRKLVVGDRDYRIVWRQLTDDSAVPILEVAEVWAAGARAHGEVYAEMTQRVDRLKRTGHPESRALADIVQQMGRLYEGIKAQPEPSKDSRLPPWLVQAVKENLRLDASEIDLLTQERAQQLLADHWSRPSDD
ncbi:type II toxin-antitoxin system RelE/ParE family toxin [Micrococcus terreus]|uniref:type II toxin-antitoxin system RelE/ParE family toxin n=1 Tax=Micrococcus terreus TaxID=574650 RepID=UPI003D70637A